MTQDSSGTVRLYAIGLLYTTDLTALGERKLDLLKPYEAVSEQSRKVKGVRLSYALPVSMRKDRQSLAGSSAHRLTSNLSLPLVLLLSSELNNFPEEQVMKSIYVEVSGFSFACNLLPREVPVEIFVRIFENGSVAVFLLMHVDAKTTVHQAIDLVRRIDGYAQGRGSGAEGGRLESPSGSLPLESSELIIGLLELLGIRERVSARSWKSVIVDHYAYTYVQSSGLRNEEVYGLADLDWTFETADGKTVRRVLNADVSMLSGIKSIITHNNNLVLFQENPQSYVEGITGFPLEDEEDELLSYMKGKFLADESEYTRATEADQVTYEWASPVLEYMVNTEPLRLQVALLREYEAEVSTWINRPEERKLSSPELKRALALELDFFYTMRFASITGVRAALEVAYKEMGIDVLEKVLNDKMSLVESSNQLEHNEQVEKWDRWLTYAATIMIVVSVTNAFIYYYRVTLNPFLAVVIMLVAGFLTFASLLEISRHSLGRGPKHTV
ncbi:MAG: hypothetical protein ACP5UI_02550 [Thermoprotei archaeon]|nr:hypothetical protein [TACK group archaeon]